MRVLFLADVESQKYWDFFDKSDFKDIDLIISCGDLKPDYLTYLFKIHHESDAGFLKLQYILIGVAAFSDRGSSSIGRHALLSLVRHV